MITDWAKEVFYEQVLEKIKDFAIVCFSDRYDVFGAKSPASRERRACGCTDRTRSNDRVRVLLGPAEPTKSVGEQCAPVPAVMPARPERELHVIAGKSFGSPEGRHRLLLRDDVPGTVVHSHHSISDDGR